MRSLHLLVTALILVSSGCSTSQRDYDFLVGHALTVMDRDAEFSTVVLAPGLPERVVAAAAKHYKVIDQTALVPMKGYDLAPGLAVLQAVTITGNEARIKLQTGPIRTGANLDCGGNHTLSYRRSSSGWTAGDTETVVC